TSKSWARNCVTSSRTWYSAPPCTNGTCASQTRIVGRIRCPARRQMVPRGFSASPLRGVAERDHVAVEDDVLLAFEAQLAMVAACGERTAREQAIARDDFGANESSRDVGVNRTGGFLCRRAVWNRPRTAL